MLYRSKKGFGAPLGRWFQEGKVDFHAADGVPLPASAAPFLDRYITEHRAGGADHRLYLFCHWLLGQQDA